MSSATAVHEHIAIQAWRRLHPNARVPAVEALKESASGGVYLLVNTGIIAKRAERETALVERMVHEDILPRLPVSSLRFHGFVEEESPFCWLFLEESVGTECSFESPRHRMLASQWLARLHGAATKLDGGALPARGTDYYLGELRSARASMLENIGNPSLRTADRELLEVLARQCNRLESRWRWVERWCENMPRTLVHGDFHPKNVHVREASGGLALYVLDWEYAGWGLAAADLPHVDLNAYAQEAAAWSGVAGQIKIERGAVAGRLFQCICAISWASTHLPYSTVERGILRFRCYPADLNAVLVELGLE